MAPKKVNVTSKQAEAPKTAIQTKKDDTKRLETKAAVLVDEADVKKPAEEKKAEKKEAVKAEPEKKAPAAKEAEAKAPETKEPAKKAPAKKPAAKKAELKTEMFLQFDGKEYTEKELIKKVKEDWTKVLKNKVGDMKSVRIYLKPQENAAYYVVNDEVSGKVEL